MGFLLAFKLMRIPKEGTSVIWYPANDQNSWYPSSSYNEHQNRMVDFYCSQMLFHWVRECPSHKGGRSLSMRKDMRGSSEQSRRVFTLSSWRRKNNLMIRLPVMCVCSIVSDSLHPMDCSLPGFSVHGISQARILDWVPVFFSRGSSQTRNQTHVSCIAGRFFTD